MLTEVLAFGVGGTVLIVGAVWLLCRFALKSPALRSTLWRVALLTLWLLPAAVLVRGMLPVEPVTIHIPVAAPTVAETPPLPAQGPSSVVAAEIPIGHQASVASHPDANPLTALPWLWAAGSLVGALLILRDVASGRRAVKRATELDEGPLFGAVTGLAQRFGLARVPCVVRSADVRMPAVFGMARPVLLLPEGFDLTSPGADAVLAHELAHIRRQDFLVQLAARTTLALLWWHPAAWLVYRELGTSAEEACDDWAIALTGSRRPYADSLLHWAETVSAAGGLACQFRGRDLIRRVQRTLAGTGVPTVNVSGKVRIALLVCTMAVAAAVGLLHIRAVAAPAETDLSKPLRATGTVLDGAGRPVAGARVGVLQGVVTELSLVAVTLDNCYATTTDANGAFEVYLPGLELEFTPRPHTGWSVWARDDARGLIGAVTIQAMPEQPLEIRLAPASYIHTRALDAEGKAIAGLRVSVSLVEVGFTGATPPTDERGEVRIGPLPADFPLRVCFSGVLDYLALNDDWADEAKPEITLTAGETRELPALRVGVAQGTLRGTVVGGDGQPVGGAEVRTIIPSAFPMKTLTDAEGAFALTGLLPTTADLWVLASRRAERLYVAQNVGQTRECQLVLRPLTSARGQLADAQGRPVPDLHVAAASHLRVGPGDTEEWWDRWAAGVPELDEVHTDARGFWEIEGLVSGAPYTVAVSNTVISFDRRRFAFVADADHPVDTGRVGPRN